MPDQDYVINQMVDSLLSNPAKWGVLIKDLYQLLASVDQKSREEMVAKLLYGGMENLPEAQFGNFIAILASNLSDMNENVRIAFLSSLVKFLESIPEEQQQKARSALDSAIIAMSESNSTESKKLIGIVLDSILLMRNSDKVKLFKVLITARFRLDAKAQLNFANTWLSVFIKLPKEQKYEIAKVRMLATKELSEQERSQDITILKTTLANTDASGRGLILELIKAYDEDNTYVQLYKDQND